MELKYPKKLSETIGRDLVEVFTDGYGVRCVWFLGRGSRDKSSPSGFSWLHYDHNIAPLSLILARPDLNGDEVNRIFYRSREISTEDLDVFTLKYYYSDADTEGPIPFFEYTNDIEDGYYIMRGVFA